MGRRKGRSHLVGVLLAVALPALVAGVSRPGAAAGAGASSGAGGARAQAGGTDPRLAQALNAFGAGRYDECRTLAQDLLSHARESGAREESVALVVLSHLGEGDFAGARQAVAHLQSLAPEACRGLLARVNAATRSHRNEQERLRRLAAAAQDPEHAARTQLWLGYAHQRAGRLASAEQAYRAVAAHYPETAEARRALSQLAEMQSESGRPEAAAKTWWTVVGRYSNSPQARVAVLGLARGQLARGNGPAALAACEKVIDVAPDTEAGAAAAGLIYADGLSLVVPRFPAPPATAVAGPDSPGIHARPSAEATQERLIRLATRHPNTRAADAARFGVGQLHAAQGRPELAERDWTSLIADRPTSPDLQEAWDALAALRLDAGQAALRQQDYPQTIRWWGALLADADFPHLARWAASPPPSVAGVPVDRLYVTVFSLGQCYEKMQQWEQAADLFRPLAEAASPPLQEMALFELAEAERQAGHYDEAEAALRGLKAAFPQSPLVVHVQDRLDWIQRARTPAVPAPDPQPDSGGAEQ